MLSKNRHHAVVLFRLIKNACNVSSNVIVEGVLGNLAEALLKFSLIQVYEHYPLPRFIEASHHRFEVLKITGFDVVSLELRFNCMEELLSRGNCGSMLCQKLWACRNAGEDETSS